MYILFFFNDTATTEIYTLSLHDALPISGPRSGLPRRAGRGTVRRYPAHSRPDARTRPRGSRGVPPAVRRGGSGTVVFRGRLCRRPALPYHRPERGSHRRPHHGACDCCDADCWVHRPGGAGRMRTTGASGRWRSEEYTSELQSPCNLVCRLLLEKKKKIESSSSDLNTSF